METTSEKGYSLYKIINRSSPLFNPPYDKTNIWDFIRQKDYDNSTSINFFHGIDLYDRIIEGYLELCRLDASNDFPEQKMLNALHYIGMMAKTSTNVPIGLDDDILFINSNLESIKRDLNAQGFSEASYLSDSTFKKLLNSGSEKTTLNQDIFNMSREGFSHYYPIVTGKEFKNTVRDVAFDHRGKCLGMGRFFDGFYDRGERERAIEAWVSLNFNIQDKLRCALINDDQIGYSNEKIPLITITKDVIVSDDRTFGKHGFESKRFKAFFAGLMDHDYEKPSILHPILMHYYHLGKDL